jgi:hypothetical protein
VRVELFALVVAVELDGAAHLVGARALNCTPSRLIAMMKVRHKGLQRKRATPEKRLKSIIKDPFKE